MCIIFGTIQLYVEFFLSYFKDIDFVLKFSGQTLLNSENQGVTSKDLHCCVLSCL